ncbi:MAG: DUF2911 domain-containing protein [Flammeovirgaceae bacterium]|jgi:hypothetical protein|nr:DUF2911 domain-containing protein [Flammeovirgaceae bacterium]
MKNILVIALLVVGLAAQAQVQTPQPSTASTVTNVVGLTEVKIEYSRPKAKGRKIFGASTVDFLTPYGKLWRTAANTGSKVTFSDDVKFGGVDVPKGTYLLLSIPGAAEWTVILYKDVAMGGNTEGYDQTKDQARVVVKSEKLSEKVETFTLEIADFAENSKSANLQIMWENTSVKVPITVDFDAKVMKSIEANTKVNPNNYFNAAVYYLENGKDLNQALAFVNKAVEANPTAFWILYQKARIQKGLNDKAGALATSKVSLEESIKAKNADYQKMNEELQKSLK